MAHVVAFAEPVSMNGGCGMDSGCVEERSLAWRLRPPLDALKVALASEAPRTGRSPDALRRLDRMKACVHEMSALCEALEQSGPDDRTAPSQPIAETDVGYIATQRRPSSLQDRSDTGLADNPEPPVTPTRVVEKRGPVGFQERRSARQPPAPGDCSRLTPQEQRILELVAKGCTNRQIACELFLAEKTVKNYVSNMLRKLGLERRTQAAVFAARLDWGPSLLSSREGAE